MSVSYVYNNSYTRVIKVKDAHKECCSHVFRLRYMSRLLVHMKANVGMVKVRYIRKGYRSVCKIHGGHACV